MQATFRVTSKLRPLLGLFCGSESSYFAVERYKIGRILQMTFDVFCLTLLKVGTFAGNGVVLRTRRHVYVKIMMHGQRWSGARVWFFSHVVLMTALFQFFPNIIDEELYLNSYKHFLFKITKFISLFLTNWGILIEPILRCHTTPAAIGQHCFVSSNWIINSFFFTTIIVNAI